MKIKATLLIIIPLIAMYMMGLPKSIAQRNTAVIKRIFVSKDGNDNNSGTLASPYRTLDRGINCVKEWKKASNQGEVELIVKAGRYFLDHPLVIDQTISGTGKYPFRIKAAKGEKVTISGGKVLDLKWARGKSGVWQAKVPNGLTFQSLYANNKKLIRARYPDYNSSILPFNGYAVDVVSPERISGWKNPKGGIIHALHSGRWGGFHYEIVAKDQDNRLILKGGEQNNRPSEMHETYRFVENIFEELNAPQEWFLNEQTNTLYYIPEEGKTPRGVEFIAPILENLVTISGSEDLPVRQVEIRGIQFIHTAPTFMKTKEPLLRSDWTIYRQGALKIEGATDCLILENDLTELGGNAIFVSNYNRNIKIKGNLIQQIGGGAINFVGNPDAVRSPSFQYDKFVPFHEMDTITGPKTNNYPADCEANDNLINAIGLIEKQVAGIQVSMAQSLRILHNTIYNVPRAGINIGDGTWGGHEIAFNDVFNTVLETGDHGAFNSWGRDRFWHPNRNEMDKLTAHYTNLILLDALKTTKIHDNRFRCDHGWDIDLDDGSSNYEIYNNVCLNGGLKLREGFYRKVYNNVIINNGFHPHVWFQNSHDVFRDNIVMMAHQDINITNWGDEVDYNIYGNKVDLIIDQAKGVEVHGKVVDLNFMDMLNADFRLKNWNNAGFKNFKMLHFGIINTRLRAIADKVPIPHIHIQNEGFQLSKPVEWNGTQIKSIETLGEQSASGLSETKGVIVVQIDEQSSLYKNGLRQGDVILSYGQVAIDHVEDLLLATKKNTSEERQVAIIFRNQQRQQLKL